MKTNSSAKLYIEFTFRYNGGAEAYPRVYQYPDSFAVLTPADSISVVPTTNTFQGESQSNFNVTYTITAKNNTSGTFQLFMGAGCTDGSFYPLVVGLNESKVNPQIYRNFNHGWKSLTCPPFQTVINHTKIIGYSGIIPKIVSDNSNTWINPTQSSTVPEFPFAILILIISIASLIMFYRTKISNRRFFTV